MADRLREFLDDTHKPYSDPVSVLQGERSLLEPLDLPAFYEFCSAHGKEFIQNAAREILNSNPDIVIGELQRKIELMIEWRRFAAAKPTDFRGWSPFFRVAPFRNPKTPLSGFMGPTTAADPYFIGELVFRRAVDVAGWLLAIELPRVPGIDWTRFAETRAQAGLGWSESAQTTLTSYSSLLTAARPIQISTEINGPRKRAHEDEYLPKALLLLKQSEGKMSLRAMAKQIGGVTYSTLCKNETIKAARRTFMHVSSQVERLDDQCGGKIRRKDMLINRRINNDE